MGFGARTMPRYRAAGVLLAAGAALLLALASPEMSVAGQWVQVSCVNPDGSAAPSEGWTGTSQGSAEFGSLANPRCTPQAPMQALLWSAQAAPYGAAELLQYAPPAGSVLVGGTLQVGLYADGYGTGPDTYDWGSAGVLEPGPDPTTPNAVKICTQSQHLCQSGGDDYLGPIQLPSEAGGDVYLFANCNGFNVNGGCNAGGSQNAWAQAQLYGARLLLRNDSVPQGSGFAGTILQRYAEGDASLGFTASDPSGPGVYEVVVEVDGHVEYAATPNTNDGECASVGSDASSSALMFDHQQPCLQSEAVLLSLATAGLRDGKHSLGVTVLDAAGNSSQVLATTITTRNSGSTLTRLPRLHVRLVFGWRFNGAHTRLLTTRAVHLPRSAAATIRCRGRGCPSIPRVRRGLARLLRALHGRVFAAGDRVLLNITAPGHTPERVLFAIRKGRVPRARLLRGR